MIDYNVTELPNVGKYYLNRTRLYLLPAVNLLKSLPAIAAVNQDINAVTTKMSRRPMSFHKI